MGEEKHEEMAEKLVCKECMTDKSITTTTRDGNFINIEKQAAMMEDHKHSCVESIQKRISQLSENLHT